MKIKQIKDIFSKTLSLLFIFSIFISFSGCNRCDCNLEDNKPLSPFIEVIKGNFEVTIIWDDVPEAEYYNLYYSINEKVSRADTIIKIVDVISPYTHKNLSTNTYWYMVTSIKGECESLASNEECVVFEPIVWGEDPWNEKVWGE